MKKIVLTVSSLVMIFLLSACGHTHEWTEATCTEPKICKECGETEGEALGHQWTEATCTEPSVCERCGEEGEGALGHTTELGRCERCGRLLGTDLIQTIIDKMDSAEKGYVTSFNAIVKSGATDVAGYKKAVDRHSAGFESYRSAVKEVIEICGDYPDLAEYKNMLIEATQTLPTGMAVASDEAFDQYFDKLEDHSYCMYQYQMLELELCAKYNAKPREVYDFE